MAVESTVSVHRYYPGAAMAAEPLAGLVFLDSADLIALAIDMVTGSEQALVEGLDYRIDGNGREGLATITALGDFGAMLFHVERHSGRRQPEAFSPFGPIRAQAVERALDRNALAVQEIAREVGRALLVPRGEAGVMLPPAALRAGGYLLFDPDGQALIDTPDNFAAPAAAAAARAVLDAARAELAAGIAAANQTVFATIAAGAAATDDAATFLSNETGEVLWYRGDGTPLGDGPATRSVLAGPDGAGRIGFLQSGAGAVERTVLDKAREFVSLSDKGVDDGDDATTALTNIGADLNAGTYRHVIIDRNVTDTTTAGRTITATGCTIEFRGTGKVTTPNIDHTTNKRWLTVAAPLRTALTVTGDIAEGARSFTVADATGVSRGDLIDIRTNVYFNGDGTPGFPNVNKAEVAQVAWVSGNTIYTEAPFDFDMAAAAITSCNAYVATTASIINPKLEGPGIQDPALGNAEGSMGLFFDHCISPSVTCPAGDGEINAYQNTQVWFSRCYRPLVDGLRMNSLENAQLTKGFYGVIDSGCKFGIVRNCFGENIRRVADTGSIFPSVRPHQENLVGVNCNGSAGGTHHAYRYTFNSIHHTGFTNALVIRAKETRGHGIYSRSTGGTAILIGSGAADTTGLANAGRVEITGIDIVGHSAGVITYMAGDFSLDGRIEGYSNTGIRTESAVDGLTVRGIIGGGLYGVDLYQASRIKNVSIEGVRFIQNTTRDIRIAGSNASATPAENIRIIGNRTNSLITSPFELGGGYFVGETVAARDNISTAGTISAVVSITSPQKWTAGPELAGNFKRLNNAQSNRGGVAKVIGRGSATSSLAGGTTVLVADLFEIEAPAAAGFPLYRCIFSGTMGTLAGVTADITSGTATATLTGNTATGVTPGMFITIAGSGTSVYRVLTVSADFATVTLNSTAASTVTGAAVGYRNPTFKGVGALEA